MTNTPGPRAVTDEMVEAAGRAFWVSQGKRGTLWDNKEGIQWELETRRSKNEVRGSARLALEAALSLAPATVSGDWVMVPKEPTEEMWGNLARDIVFWARIQPHDGYSLHKHLRSLGREIPDWLVKEIPPTNRVPPKGTVAACIYKAMLSAAPKAPASGDASDRTSVILPRDAFEKFIQTCENPPAPTEKLKALFRDYAVWEKSQAPVSGVVTDDELRDKIIAELDYTNPYKENVANNIIAAISNPTPSQKDDRPDMWVRGYFHDRLMAEHPELKQPQKDDRAAVIEECAKVAELVFDVDGNDSPREVDLWLGGKKIAVAIRALAKEPDHGV